MSFRLSFGCRKYASNLAGENKTKTSKDTLFSKSIGRPSLMEVQEKLDLSQVAEKRLRIKELVISLNFSPLRVDCMSAVPDELLEDVESLDGIDAFTAISSRILTLEQFSHAVLALINLIQVSGGYAVDDSHDIGLHLEGFFDGIDHFDGLDIGALGFLELMIESNDHAVNEVELSSRNNVHLIRLIPLAA